MKRAAICLVCLIVFEIVPTHAQINYGMTGLMNMPTADMQRDKTFMFGGNVLDKHVSVPRWWYDTWNYYVNITMFPWFEFGYLCTGHKSVPTDYGNKSGFWVPNTYGKWVNQDRSFHIRLRLWKEGWWKEWTPQVVVGGNDMIGDSWKISTSSNPSKLTYTNGFLNRYYLAVTKHFLFDGIGELGAHLTWIYSQRFDNNLNNPAVGVNFRPKLKEEAGVIGKLANQLNVMAEFVPGYTEVNDDLTFKADGKKYHFNVGAEVGFWRDFVNATVELGDGKYLSGGLQFKVHLK